MAHKNTSEEGRSLQLLSRATFHATFTSTCPRLRKCLEVTEAQVFDEIISMGSIARMIRFPETFPESISRICFDI